MKTVVSRLRVEEFGLSIGSPSETRNDLSLSSCSQSCCVPAAHSSVIKGVGSTLQIRALVDLFAETGAADGYFPDFGNRSACVFGGFGFWRSANSSSQRTVSLRLKKRCSKRKSSISFMREPFTLTGTVFFRPSAPIKADGTRHGCTHHHL
jgi:hypothetical protein